MMQRWLLPVKSRCFGAVAGTLVTQRHAQSTAAADAHVEPSPASEPTPAGKSPTVGSSTNTTDSSRLQQLYKSSHKGTGSTPMPKPFQERKLRPRRPPPGVTEVDPAPAPLFGARSSCAEDAGPVPQRPLSPLQKRQLQFRNKAAFILTPQALRRVKFLLGNFAAARPGSSSSSSSGRGAGEAVALPCGIRIGVRRRGCSGYSYTVNYYFEPAAMDKSGAAAAPPRKKGGMMDDVVVEQDGVKVVVDGDALFYVIGTEMDYVVRNVEEKFTFKNPNQKYGCGCEESFMPFDSDDMDDD